MKVCVHVSCKHIEGKIWDRKGGHDVLQGFYTGGRAMYFVVFHLFFTTNILQSCFSFILKKMITIVVLDGL